MSLVHARFIEPTRTAMPAEFRRPATGPIIDLTGALTPELEPGPLRRLLRLGHQRAWREWSEDEAHEAFRLVAELGPEVGDG